jgi:hypothetical protein
VEGSVGSIETNPAHQLPAGIKSKISNPSFAAARALQVQPCRRLRRQLKTFCFWWRVKFAGADGASLPADLTLTGQRLAHNLYQQKKDFRND